MNLTHIIAELQEEKAKLDRAILALERLSNGAKAERGRPRLYVQTAAKSVANTKQTQDNTAAGIPDSAARGQSA